MNYFEELTDVRERLLQAIDADPNIITRISKETGVGTPSLFSLIHQERPTRIGLIRKIKVYLDSVLPQEK